MILTLDQVSTWRTEQRETGKRVVATNGCFDILHLGHVRYLSQARELGDVLIVGLNSDESVKKLKGADRPINSEDDRAEILNALRIVDAVVIFPEVRATGFLNAVQPDVYVKGGDYTLDQLDRDEVATVQKHGGRIEILPIVPGRSTTSLLKRIGAI
jgi:rfaE bifunctional protein nucleotidyltransferase chain/domain